MFCCSSRLMVRVRFVTLAVVKPVSSALISYVPSGSAPKRYLPSASVTEDCVNPVLMLRAVTVTPGRTPPCASVTVPPMTPRSPWAAAGAESPSVSSSASTAHAPCCEENTARNLTIAPPGDPYDSGVRWTVKAGFVRGQLYSRGDGLAHFLRRGFSAEIGRFRAAFAHRFDRALHSPRRLGKPEVIEHQRRRPDGANRVGDVAAGDVGRRPMHRLEHRWKLPLGIEICRRRDADAARDRRT